MNAFFKKCILILLTGIMTFGMSACGNSAGYQSSYRPFKDSKAGSGVVSENKSFELLWDNSQKCVLLRDLRNGKIWSSTPYDYYCNSGEEGTARVRLCSPIIVNYYETSTFQEKTALGYSDCISYNTVLAQKTKYGLRVTYYFERLEISIPVEYRLNEEGLEVRLPVNEIKEGANLVTKVSLLPYFASAKPADGSYLIIPSGSGALMYTDEGKRNTRTFSGEVYGEDLNSDENEQLGNDVGIKLPFFGVRDGKNSICVILDEGKETAEISASAGDSETGYSSAYVSWNIRSHSYISTQNMHGVTTVVAGYPYERLSRKYCSALYIPLEKENQDYTDIAKVYRERLKTENSGAESRLYVNIMGGKKQKKYIFGVPVNTLSVLTTVKEAAGIIEELADVSDNSLSVRLSGFGTSGIDIGKPGGGLKIPQKIGSKKDIDGLMSLTEKRNLSIFLDFDISAFSSSGSGISYYYGCAKNPNGLSLTKYRYLPDTYNKDPKQAYRLTGRGEINKLAEKAVDYAYKRGFSGISFGSISESAYSDFGYTEYFCKNNFGNQWNEIAGYAAGRKISAAAVNANSYAADSAACIFESPLGSDASDAFDEEIPLYQIVYKGRVPLSGESINLSDNRRETFLKSVSTGCGLCYTLSENGGEKYYSYYSNAPVFSAYEKEKEEIAAFCRESKQFLSSVQGASIERYYALADAVYRTVFSNGVEITVNYSENSYTENGITVSANGFYVSGGEK